jgi:hypothetical protein
MKLFNATRAYVAVFLVYALATFNVAHHSATRVGHPHGSSNPTLLAMAVGSPYCVILLLWLIRRTTNWIERAVLVLSAAFFLTFFLDVLHQLGFVSAAVPSHHAVSFVIICLATLLIGARILQLLTYHRKENGRAGTAL